MVLGDLEKYPSAFEGSVSDAHRNTMGQNPHSVVDPVFAPYADDPLKNYYATLCPFELLE